MNVSPGLFEPLSEPGDDTTRSKIIAEAFTTPGDHANKSDLAELESKLRQTLMETEYRLEKKMAENRFDLLRWLALVAFALETFVFITLLVVLVGK